MTTMEIRPTASLPRGIRRGLGRVDHRLRVLGTLRGLGTVALVLSVGAALGMAADFTWALTPSVRWAIWGAWVASGLIVALAMVVRPLVRRIGWNDLAALAERDHPQLGERLTSAVALLDRRAKAHGSPVLIAALAEDADRRAATLDLARGVSGRRALGWLALGMLMVGLVVAPGAARPDPFGTLGRRFLIPWADLDRVNRLIVTVRPGDRVVAIGSDLTVSAEARPRFGGPPAADDAWLEYNDAQGAEQRLRMAPAAASGLARGFALTLPRLASSLTYRVAVGSARSRQFRIEAVEPPGVANLSARVEPPAYTRLAASNARTTERIGAWQGSRITLTLAANKPVRQVEVEWPVSGPSTGSPPSQWFPLKPTGDGKTWTASLVADASGPYRFRLKDRHDLVNRPEPARHLAVRIDQPPTVALTGPDAILESQPDDVLMVGASARDDLAVASAELHYAIERAGSASEVEEGHVPAPLPGLGTRTARGEAALVLKTLALRPGDVVSYRMRVADSLPAPRGPNVAWSGSRTLRVVAKAEPLAERRGSAVRESLRAKLEAIKQATAATRKETEQLRYAADAAQHGNGRWDPARDQALSRREAESRSVVDKLKELAHDFRSHPNFAPLADPTRQVAEIEAEASRAKIDEARRASEPGKRLDNLREADARLAATQARLDDLQRQFDALAKRDDDRRRLRDLAAREDDLAQRAEARADDPAKLDPIRAEQEQVRRELDELMKQSPALRAEALAAQARKAKDLAERIHELADRQHDEARKAGDLSRHEDALKGLAEAQRQLENDARRLALDVDHPLEENERGRVNTEALKQAIDPLVRGDVEQGRRQLEEGEGSLNRLARDLEDVAHDPRALARRLARRQEALRNQVAEVVREAKGDLTPEAKAALAERLKPMAEKQEAIAKLAAAIPVPEAQRDAARVATETTARPVGDLHEPHPREVEGHQNEARDALNRLADALPDANRRRDEARQKIEEARRRTEEVARDLENHLRETAPRPGQPFDPARAASDFAQRIEPLARKEAEAAAILAALETEPRAEPQRERAERRARALAEALETIRTRTPQPPPPQPEPSRESKEPRPLLTWRVIGPFDLGDKSAVDPSKPTDLNAKAKGRNGAEVAWKVAVPANDQGLIDLGRIYSMDANQAAFGYTEITSPRPSKAQMAVGSDDTLTVWLNGKPVYDFPGNRSFSAGADRFEVELTAGVNRLLVHCGNTAQQWKYAVAMTPPPPGPSTTIAWQVLGPFPLDGPAPIEPSKPIDLSVKTQGRDGAEVSWQAAPPDDAQGRIDLGKRFSNGGKPGSAFGHAEISSPAKGKARLLIGSDDTLTVWLNGKQVFDYQEGRIYHFGQDQVDVEVIEGVNRLVVKCGNRAGDWTFAVTATDLPPGAANESERALARKEEEDAARVQARREALPALQADARASVERLAQKVEGRTPADDLAVELAEDQDALEQHPEAGDQQRIATALRNLDAPDATVQRAEAVRTAERAAEALAEPGRDPKPAVREAAKAAEALAHRLTDSLPAREQAAALARAQHTLDGPDAPIDPAERARQQRTIAEELARMPAEGKEPATRRVREAADLAERAARPAHEGPAPDPAEVASARAEAAKELDALAARQPHEAQAARPGPEHPGGHPHAQAPDDPELGLKPAQAGAARDLARRERRIRERLQSILGQGVGPQERLRDEASALGRELADLRDEARETSPRSQGPAHAAADLLGNHAPRAMAQGAEQLAQGRPDQARDAQRQAAEFVERAAQQADDMAAGLRADRPAEALAGARSGTDPARLGSAREAMGRAGQHLARAHEPGQGTRPGQAAAASMHQAAEQLRAATQGEPGGEPSSLAGEPGPSSDAPKTASESADPESRSNPAGKGDPDLAMLQAAIRAKTGRAWGELPGHLRTEILQMSQGQYRDDYARLIQLYFQEIAAGERDAP